MNEFQKKILRQAEKKDSKLVLDLHMAIPVRYEKDQEVLIDKAFRIYRDTKNCLAGIRISRSFIDAVGYLNMKILAKELKVPLIADLRLADTGNDCVSQAGFAFGNGFDAVTMQAFTGREPIQAVMKNFSNKGVLAILDMAHPSASDFLTPSFEKMCSITKELAPAGAVIPRSKIYEISQVRNLVNKDVLIFASTLGFQEEAYGSALKAGADFEIVGRYLYDVKDPKEEIIKILEETR